MTGTIVRLMRQKAFGFILGSDGRERFFHTSGLEQTTLRYDQLDEGMRVEFESIEAPKGLRAIEVRVIE